MRNVLKRCDKYGGGLQSRARFVSAIWRGADLCKKLSQRTRTDEPFPGGRHARSHIPELAISAFAVAWNLGMVVISPLAMFHQMPLRYIETAGGREEDSVKRFALYLATGLFAVMAVLNLTALTVAVAVGALLDLANPAVEGIAAMMFCQGTEALYLHWISQDAPIAT